MNRKLDAESNGGTSDTGILDGLLGKSFAYTSHHILLKKLFYMFNNRRYWDDLDYP